MDWIPNDKLVLRKEIIQGICEKYIERTGDKNFDRFYEDLKLYTEKDPVGREALRAFEGKLLPNKKTIERALTGEGRNAGATELLRDLLCFYAFGISWKEKIGELGSDYKTELAESKRRRAIIKKPVEEIVVDELSNLRSDLRQQNEMLLTKIEQFFEAERFNEAIINAVDDIHSSLDEGNVEKLEKPFRTLIERSRERTLAYSAFNGFHSYELSKLLMQENKFDEVIEVMENSLQIAPDFQLTHFRIAEAYSYTDQYELALIHLDKVISISPFDLDALVLQIICHNCMKAYEKAKELSLQTIEWYKQEKLHSTELHIADLPFKLTYEKHPPRTNAYLWLMRECAKAHKSLDDDKSALQFVDEGLRVEENKLLFQLKVSILIKNDLPTCLELCKLLVKKFPDDLPFWQMLIALSNQTNEEKKIFLDHCNRFIGRYKESGIQWLFSQPALQKYHKDSAFQKLVYLHKRNWSRERS